MTLEDMKRIKCKDPYLDLDQETDPTPYYNQ